MKRWVGWRMRWVGWQVGVPENVIGLTALAWANSVPDAIACYLLARRQGRWPSPRTRSLCTQPALAQHCS
jgi:hypothetical protein